MKRLLTISTMLVSSLAMGQFPNLPYNPDDNGDGLIGVVDLQGLLSNYGNEFSGAVISEDGENAITYMGDMAYPQCVVACRNLPGMWEMPDIGDLGLVWSEVYTTNSPVQTWLAPVKTKIQENDAVLDFFSSPSSSDENSHTLDITNNPARNYGCYCAARQLPRVEYSVCSYYSNGNYTPFGQHQTCAQEKVAEGWYPLNGATNSDRTGGQAFWRWAE